MDQQTANKIIVDELNKYYQLCKYQPSPVIWVEFLETLDEPTAIKLDAEYNHETAFKTLWIYKHWYIQRYHKSEIDEIMKLVLTADVYSFYCKRYKKQETQQS